MQQEKRMLAFELPKVCINIYYFKSLALLIAQFSAENRRTFFFFRIVERFHALNYPGQEQ